jgi:hypothetical protein
MSRDWATEHGRTRIQEPEQLEEGANFADIGKVGGVHCGSINYPDACNKDVFAIALNEYDIDSKSFTGTERRKTRSQHSMARYFFHIFHRDQIGNAVKTRNRGEKLQLKAPVSCSLVLNDEGGMWMSSTPSFCAEFVQHMKKSHFIPAPQSIRKPAKDQTFAKARCLDEDAAARIADAAYDKILADTGSEEFALEFRKKTRHDLTVAVPW